MKFVIDTKFSGELRFLIQARSQKAAEDRVMKLLASSSLPISDFDVTDVKFDAKKLSGQSKDVGTRSWELVREEFFTPKQTAANQKEGRRLASLSRKRR